MSWQPDNRHLDWLKRSLILIGLLPLARLLWASHSGDLGPEPESFVQTSTGIWACNFLLLTLCISPLRAITQLHWLLRLRRLFGLFAFFYASLHLLSFIGYAHEFALDEIARDVIKRPFAIVGFAAFALLIPLAATSNQWSIRRLGGRRWQELHRNIYLIGILVAVHFLWSSKASELAGPITYALALGALLAWRIRERRRKAIPVPATSAGKPLRYFSKRPE